MAKPQVAVSEPARAPYVKPRILTLKADLSFASSVTTFEDIIALADPPQHPATNKEPASNAKATAGDRKTLTPHP